MGRDHRPNIAGGIYHIFDRGNRREPIFRVDHDYERFLLYLADEVERRSWKCLSYCLIPNHYHFAVETPEPNLSQGLHRLNLRWARRFNKEYGLVGHVFQGRFGSELIQDELYLLSVLRYIARNPVNAGLCRDPADWAWSSYAELVGTAPPRWIVNFQRLCEVMSATPTEGTARLMMLAAA